LNVFHQLDATREKISNTTHTHIGML